MKVLEFTIEIKATKEVVWETLWSDRTLREWAGLIDPGTFMIGELKEGNEVQFISESGYGVTSIVEKIIPREYLLLRHSADTKNEGRQVRAKEWTGGKEIYSLAESAGKTTLKVKFDVPEELEEIFKVSYPKALEKVKHLAETKRPT